jgi:hypothetical protein
MEMEGLTGFPTWRSISFVSRLTSQGRAGWPNIRQTV